MYTNLRFAEWLVDNIFSIGNIIIHCTRKTGRLANNILTFTGHAVSQGRNMVYSGPIDPYFLAIILIPEPHFPQNLDP